MDSKFYVSSKVAKLLRDKGYDIKRDFLTPVYNENGCLYWSNHEDLSDKIPAITKDEAIDWLESKGIVVEVNMNYCGLNNWHYILHRENRLKTMYSEDDDIYFSTRLEAEDAAIINACKLLENGN